MTEVATTRITQGALELDSESYRFSKAPGWWMAFFLVMYIIIIFKLTSSSVFTDSIFFSLYTAAITMYIFSRFLLSYLHAPIATDPDYEPTITFVVPAKNEEDNIGETIRRFAQVDYPGEKIEVIAINDGSDDNTYAEMLKACHEIKGYVGRIELVDFTQNMGKRHGMAEGARSSHNDIVIFIDSDSFVERDCVRNIVKYFSQPKIGAVSGHTDVYNRDTNILTQMQTIRYFIAFKVYKAAESVFGNVTCCPGSCSAYRREYLMEFIDEWLHQKFWGTECTFGDDRSLTNYMIRKYHATYASDARAQTVVPENFGKYVRQQARWKKSWIRETMIAATFVWRKNWIAAFFFYTYIFLAFASPIVFVHAVIWNPTFNGIMPYVYFFGLLLMLLLHGVYYRIHVGAKPWFMAIVTFWFYGVMLMWQLPWALITISDTRWGTR